MAIWELRVFRYSKSGKRCVKVEVLTNKVCNWYTNIKKGAGPNSRSSSSGKMRGATIFMKKPRAPRLRITTCRPGPYELHNLPDLDGELGV